MQPAHTCFRCLCGLRATEAISASVRVAGWGSGGQCLRNLLAPLFYTCCWEETLLCMQAGLQKL